MDEIYTKIQVYLIKKDKECEKLKFLTSRTTPSNEAHVSEVCDTIKDILKDSSSLITDEKSIQNFKFILLNTYFKSQEYLCEDIANGHLVDMCPPLSPYLFIQIIWALGYDDIMSNSILYIPMDLCCDILDAMRRSLDVDFQRACNTVLKVVTNCYKRLVSAHHQDAQVLEERESIKRFVGSAQELLIQLADFQSKNIQGLSQLAKYERRGWALIRLLNTTKDCIEAGRTEGEGQELEGEKLYRVTFGRDFMTRIDPDLVAEAVDTLLKELVDLLLANVKKIDCYVYMGWAELDYSEDSSMSMQRAVGLACYHFIEFLGADKRPEEYSHVVECLQQLSSKPDAPFSMSLKELCSEIEKKGSRECLRKLIHRYEEWDSPAILCLDNNRTLLDKDDCLSLLNSAVKFFDIYTEGDLRAEVYATAMKILLGIKLVDMVEVIVEFILIHNASRALESTNFEPDLNSYVNQGLALCLSNTSLRIVLFFVIQNPREVLKTLIRAAVGYPEYTNSMILPQDLCKLSPIMQIRDSNRLSLLSNSLREICGEDVTWNGKKFVDLVRVLVEKNLVSVDDLMNDILIPSLRNVINLENIQTIITCIRTLKDYTTRKLKKQELLHVLALQMAYLRKNTDLSLYSKEEAMNSLVRIIQHFSKARISSAVDEGEDLYRQKLEASLEPLDKIYFASQWGWIRNEIGLDQVLEDYKRSCFHVINESKPDKICLTDMEEVLEAHGLETGDFLQHLILRCTEFEYLRFAKEALLINWNYFCWDNEVDAYAKFSLATIKACSNCLESFDLINSWEYSVQKFASLIKSLAKLTIWFISIDVMEDYESVQKSLVIAMSSLNLRTTVFPDLSRFYKEFKASLSQPIDTIHSYEMVNDLVHKVDKFGDQCLRHCYQPVGNRDPKFSEFYLNSTFISICLNWPVEENGLLLSKIDKKLYSRQR